MLKYLKYSLILLLSISNYTVLANNNSDSLNLSDKRKFDYFFYEGLNLKAAGKYDAAYDAFNYCLNIDSTAAPVLYELSSFYAQLDKQGKSLEMLQRAVVNDPENYTYKRTLASVYRNMGKFGEAAETYEELIKSNPDKYDLNYFLAEALTQKGDYGKAIDAYNALENAMGMKEPISIQKYKLYTALEKEEEAALEIKKLSDKFPMESRYYMMLGDIYLDKDTTTARAYYEKAHSIDPGNPYYSVSMANYYDATNNKEAAEKQIRSALVNDRLEIKVKTDILSSYIMRLQREQKDMKQAEALFKTLLDQHPDNIQLKQMYGGFLLSQKKDEEAKEQFQIITEIAPEDESSWQRLLEFSLQKENLDEVERICLRCQQLFPESPTYYFYLGICYFQKKDYDKSMQTYRDGLKIIPNDDLAMKSNFYGQIGDLYHEMGKPTESYKAYDEALKYNDKNIVVLNNYAYFLSLEKKDLKKAERMSATCIKLAPNNSTYLDTYAWIFFIQGEYKLAKIYIQSALANDTEKSSELVDHYGDILYMCGEKEKALEQWKKAKALGKESEILNRKIAEKKFIEDTNAE